MQQELIWSSIDWLNRWFFLHIFTTFIVRITCQAFLVICGSTTLACKMSVHIFFCRNHMGPFGTMKWTDGRCYEGQFRDGISGLILSLSFFFWQFFQHHIVLYRMLTIPNNAANAVNSLWEKTVSFSQARSMAKASFLGLMDDRTQARKDLRTWGYAKLSNKTWPINYHFEHNENRAWPLNPACLSLTRPMG